jgi:ketosteroid isomerase-like protein
MIESERVSRLRQGYAAYNEGDFDGVAELLDPDFEMVRAGGSPESADTIRGADAFRAFMEPDLFESMLIEIVAVHETPDRVLFETFIKAVGAGSGAEVTQRSFQVWDFSPEGLPTRMATFFDRAEAFRGAGISTMPKVD